MNPFIHCWFPFFGCFYIKHFYKRLYGDALYEYSEVYHCYRGGDEHWLKFHHLGIY